MKYSRNTGTGILEQFTNEGVYAGKVFTMGDFISEESKGFSDDDLDNLVRMISDGGPGSGNFGHAGRPGKRGGSAKQSSGSTEGAGRSEYHEKLAQKREEVMSQSPKDQSYFLLEEGFLEYEDAVKAWREGTAGELAKQYFDIMEKNGDPTPTKEARKAPDINDEVMYKKKWESSNNGLTDPFTTARLAYIQDWTGCDEKEAWHILDEMGTWFSGSWGRADTETLDKYIDDDGVYDGEIYRGIELDQDDYEEFMKNAQPGGTVKMIGMNSSWTSDKEMAYHFSGSSEDSRHIVFRCIKNRTAAPVSHLSTHGEDEVLAHSRAQWTVMNVQEGTNRTIITVVESEHRMSKEERDLRRKQFDSVPDKKYESLPDRMQAQQKYFRIDPLETSVNDGGPGSGNFGHKGRPGSVGGSGKGGSTKQYRPHEEGNNPEHRVIPRKRENRSKPIRLHGKRAANVTSYRDITNEYKENARPGEGKFEIDPGVDVLNRVDDIKIAKWLHSEFGGDIRVLEEIHKNKRVSNPDYLWNGRLWDLKTPDSKSYSALNDRPRTGIKQIRRNPGGIIMDLNKCGASLEDAEIAVRNRMYTSADFAADVIILYKGDKYKVLRFE